MNYSLKKTIHCAFATTILLGGSLVFAAISQAQMPDWLQQELDRTDQIINEGNREVERLQPEVQRQQQYEVQLWNACMNGNQDACRKYQSIQQRRQIWMEQNDCLYRTGLNRCR